MTKYLNRVEKKEVPVADSDSPIQTSKIHTVMYRVAGMVGANGPYTVTVNDAKREKEISQAPYFCAWLTPMMIVHFEEIK